MALISMLLYVIGLVCLLGGLPPVVAPSLVRGAVPAKHAERIGDRRGWRGFGAGLVSIGLSTLVIANGLAA